MIRDTLLISWIMPATWPAMNEPLSQSPSLTARRSEPIVIVSSCSKETPSSDKRLYSRAIAFLRTRTGAPVRVP